MRRPLIIAAGLVIIAGLSIGSFGLIASAAVPKQRPEDHEKGEELWERSCWQCHGKGNAGDGPAASALVGGVPNLQGKIGKDRYDKLVPVIMKGRGAMPAFAAELDEHNARRILIYLNRLDEEESWPDNTIEEDDEDSKPKKKSEASDDEAGDDEPGGDEPGEDAPGDEPDEDEPGDDEAGPPE